MKLTLKVSYEFELSLDDQFLFNVPLLPVPSYRLQLPVDTVTCPYSHLSILRATVTCPHSLPVHLRLRDFILLMCVI